MESIFVYGIHLTLILASVGVAGALFEMKIATSEGYKRFRRRALLRASKH